MRNAGMPGAQGEELAGAIRDSQENLANEDDMEKLRKDLKADALEVNSRLTWRLLGGMFALLTIFATAIIAILRLLPPPAAG